MKKIIILICLLCLVNAGMSQSAIFVSAAAANDNGDGLSWENAKKTIAAGLSVAGENGTVYVKAGTYNISATLVIPQGVSVRGGYGVTATGTDTAQVLQRLPGLNSQWANVTVCTIIVGDGAHRLATVNGSLEACVLRRGFDSDKGGGVFIDGGTVRYCVIKECDAINETTLKAEGGGAYIRNGGLLTNCVITECRADKGPAVSGGNGSLINNTITRNWPTHCGTVTDYDGNVYNTVVIGQQCWTKQNMRSMHYYDGSAIPMGSENSYLDPYYYVNYTAIPSSMLNQYGYLYNWKAAMHGAPSSNANPSGVTGICPQGWHLPSDTEFVIMREFVNTILANRCSGYDHQIAKSLASKTQWPSSSGCNVGSNPSSNNNTLFSAYPSGYYNNGFSSSNNASLWTTTEINSVKAISYYINYDNTNLNTNNEANKGSARSVRCVKNLSASEPIVHTSFVTVLSTTSVKCGGTCSDGGYPITSRGLCWSTSPKPTINDNHSNEGAGEGTFTSVISNLISNTTYYVRAYYENSNSVYYGEERTFIPGDCGILVVTDIDGNTYNTVQIGDQCWIKENLRCTHFADGEEIPFTSNSSLSAPYYYQYGDVSVYGFLYNWPAVMHGASSSNANPSGVQGICPSGWHVPSHDEWTELYQYVSSHGEFFCNNDSTYIGKALASTTGWNNSNTMCDVGNNQESNNTTGFNATPAGYYFDYYKYSINYKTFFWTATASDSDSAYDWSLQKDSKSFVYGIVGKHHGFSVRCVRNE